MEQSKTEINLNNKNILVTGVAGFIGANLARRLISDFRGLCIIGLDNLNSYYDSEIKKCRLEKIRAVAETENRLNSFFHFIEGDIIDKAAVNELFRTYTPTVVVNFAAQAGVRYSIENPDAYIQSNIIGFYNILEACRYSYDNGQSGVQHLVYASSSSVYGGNTKVPFSEEDSVDNPVSLYAATKKSNELLAHSYSKLYSIPSTGLRFFTVYGPAGRPDMAYFSFTQKLILGEKIKIFNYGNCKRDFTYIDDIIEGIVRVMQKAPKKGIGTDGLPIPPYSVYNIGNSHPENLMEFVHLLSEELVRAEVLPPDFNLQEHIEFVAMQQGDVPVTYADISKMERDYSFKPKTDLRSGLRAFAEWYREFYL